MYIRNWPYQCCCYFFYNHRLDQEQNLLTELQYDLSKFILWLEEASSVTGIPLEPGNEHQLQDTLQKVKVTNLFQFRLEEHLFFPVNHCRKKKIGRPHGKKPEKLLKYYFLLPHILLVCLPFLPSSLRMVKCFEIIFLCTKPVVINHLEYTFLVLRSPLLWEGCNATTEK